MVAEEDSSRLQQYELIHERLNVHRPLGTNINQPTCTNWAQGRARRERLNFSSAGLLLVEVTWMTKAREEAINRHFRGAPAMDFDDFSPKRSQPLRGRSRVLSPKPGVATKTRDLNRWKRAPFVARSSRLTDSALRATWRRLCRSHRTLPRGCARARRGAHYRGRQPVPRLGVDHVGLPAHRQGEARSTVGGSVCGKGALTPPSYRTHHHRKQIGFELTNPSFRRTGRLPRQ